MDEKNTCASDPLNLLRLLKEQTPKLADVLNRFAIAQEEYDRIMLDIIASQRELGSTYGTAENL